ncbi:MAG: hypothetical protein FP816_20995 [Desulfobacteraceae bacterium]|nr:hypothetical protein [Desulfobacteraceae bacterium]MBU4055050.1 hypothetical protein [Pseudomonadota bacterium]
MEKIEKDTEAVERAAVLKEYECWKWRVFLWNIIFSWKIRSVPRMSGVFSARVRAWALLFHFAFKRHLRWLRRRLIDVRTTYTCVAFFWPPRCHLECKTELPFFENFLKTEQEGDVVFNKVPCSFLISVLPLEAFLPLPE